jgi:hypothetical protein
MVKDYSKQEDDVWNVAGGYTRLKILGPLVECDKYIMISIYGSWDIDGSIGMDEMLKNDMRLEALRRLIDNLYLVIENTKFVIKQKYLPDINFLKDELDIINKYSNRVYDYGGDLVNSNKLHRKINEEFFMVIINKLRDIKEKINIPLYKSKLIFPADEDFDIDEFKRAMKEKIVEGG